MSLEEHAPGKSRRIQVVGDGGRCSSVWSVFSAKHSADLYIVPRMFGGAVKVSLHESGSWQAGLTKEAAVDFTLSESRHWEIWNRGNEQAAGVVPAWSLLIPDEELRSGAVDPKAHIIPPVGANHASSIHFLMMSNEGPTVNFDDDVYIVGRWRLCGRDESCLLVARRIPWTSDLREWAEVVRKQVAAQAAAAGIEKDPNHRYYLHGHNAEGVRFGLELAAS
jgi:hypothetical protein